MLKRIGAEESGEFKAVASGTLPSGQPVIVNADGTVSVVSETVNTESVSSGVVFESASSGTPAIGYDTSNDKVVIAYTDSGNSSYGTAVVGTVSGISISFGTPVVFESASENRNRVVFDSSNNKILICYTDNGNSSYGTAIVGTVSGTSISFGTASVFNSGSTTNIAAGFDSTANKTVIGYRDASDSSKGKAVVATISDTSVSFGSATQFNSGTTRNIAVVHDSNANKTVIAYEDVGNSGYGTAIVGTVSGTSISFGSEVVFESADCRDEQISYDPINQKVLIVFKLFSGFSGNGIVGTVSGTSISFGTKVVFHSGSTDVNKVVYDSAAQKHVILYRDQDPSPNHGRIKVATISGTSVSYSDEFTWSTTNFSEPAITYDPDQGKVVIAYVDSNNSQYGTARVYQTAYTEQNLTSENYIGMSKGGAVADTKGATLDIIGAVNDEQSGLTPGQQYFVQTDGTIGTTAATPSVLAGTAISATELLVKT